MMELKILEIKEFYEKKLENDLFPSFHKTVKIYERMIFS